MEEDEVGWGIIVLLLEGGSVAFEVVELDNSLIGDPIDVILGMV